MAALAPGRKCTAVEAGGYMGLINGLRLCFGSFDTVNLV